MLVVPLARRAASCMTVCASKKGNAEDWVRERSWRLRGAIGLECRDWVREWMLLRECRSLVWASWLGRWGFLTSGAAFE